MSATTHALPDSLRALLSDTLLPEGLKPARVPVTIHMRLGKNDAGVCGCEGGVRMRNGADWRMSDGWTLLLYIYSMYTVPYPTP